MPLYPKALLVYVDCVNDLKFVGVLLQHQFLLAHVVLSSSLPLEYQILLYLCVPLL